MARPRIRVNHSAKPELICRENGYQQRLMTARGVLPVSGYLLPSLILQPPNLNEFQCLETGSNLSLIVRPRKAEGGRTQTLRLSKSQPIQNKNACRALTWTEYPRKDYGPQALVCCFGHLFKKMGFTPFITRSLIVLNGKIRWLQRIDSKTMPITLKADTGMTNTAIRSANGNGI